MTIFDTDVLTDILAGRADYVARFMAISAADRTIAMTVAEEVIDGWMITIRNSRGGHGRLNLVEAYERLRRCLLGLRTVELIPYSSAAHVIFTAHKAAGVKVKSQDLRIASTAIAHGAVLATRNQRDFQNVPGLILDIWP